MLATGELGPDSYGMDDARVAELEKKVVLLEDLELTRSSTRGASLKIKVNSETLWYRVERVSGDPAQPMTREEVLEKFRRYAGFDGAGLLDAPGEAKLLQLNPLSRFLP